MTITVTKLVNGTEQVKTIEKQDLPYYETKGWKQNYVTTPVYSSVKKGRKHTED